MSKSEECRELILKHLGSNSLTANEVIKIIQQVEMRDGVDRDIHFYTHLNKYFSPLEKKGAIAVVGEIIGPTNREEKVWKALRNL